MEMPIEGDMQTRKSTWKSPTSYGCALAIVVLLAIAVTRSAQAQTFSVIHTFAGGQDGASPRAGLTIDAGGNLYGTTYSGGAGGNGTVYKLTRTGSSWILNPVYSFAGGNDGAGPFGGMVFGPNGSIYGTTRSGGGGSGCQVYDYTGCGTIFDLAIPPNAICGTAPCPLTENVLYRFSGGSDGAHPAQGDLNFDRAGNIYGATYQGGSSGCGTVFKLTRSGSGWTEGVLYAFTGAIDGCFAHAVTFDQVGNLYGTAITAGAHGLGTVFQLSPSGSGWVENTLYSFQGGTDGQEPVAGVIFDGSGNMYGSTVHHGQGGGGTVFELTPSGGGWTFSTIYGLSGSGSGPQATLMDQAGSLYGTTFSDGAHGLGSVFKLTPSGGGTWTYTSLYDFTGGSDGANPYSNLVFDASGNLYGTTSAGGTGLACSGGCGVVFEITP
jgi:uncharacterized repeat protein (TIGR03803 family)